MGKSTSHVTLLLNTVTYDYHFVEQLTVFLQRYLDLVLTSHGNSLVAIADIRNDEATILWNTLEGKVTVKIGHRTSRGSLYNDTCTDDGFTGSVNYSS